MSRQGDITAAFELRMLVVVAVEGIYKILIE